MVNIASTILMNHCAMRYSLLVFLLLGLFTLSASAQPESLLNRADSLFSNYQEKAALEAYNKVLQEDSDNLEALWRTSLLYSRIGNQLNSEDQKTEYYNFAKQRAEQALQEDSTNSQANFVMSVAMGRMALIVGARERVAASRDIKKYAERALRADSTNAGAWHVLGRWNMEISDLNFAERLAANVLFGGIPEGASNENAVEYIQRAIELNPNFALYYYDLAKAYEALGQEQQAIETCKEGLAQPTLAPGDDEVKQDCRDLIDDLQ